MAICVGFSHGCDVCLAIWSAGAPYAEAMENGGGGCFQWLVADCHVQR